MKAKYNSKWKLRVDDTILQFSFDLFFFFSLISTYILLFLLWLQISQLQTPQFGQLAFRSGRKIALMPEKNDWGFPSPWPLGHCLFFFGFFFLIRSICGIYCLRAKGLCHSSSAIPTPPCNASPKSTRRLWCKVPRICRPSEVCAWKSCPIVGGIQRVYY